MPLHFPACNQACKLGAVVKACLAYVTSVASIAWCWLLMQPEADYLAGKARWATEVWAVPRFW